MGVSCATPLKAKPRISAWQSWRDSACHLAALWIKIRASRVLPAGRPAQPTQEKTLWRRTHAPGESDQSADLIDPHAPRTFQWGGETLQDREGQHPSPQGWHTGRCYGNMLWLA